MHKIRDLLRQLRATDFWSGAKELFWMVLFGLMPLWVGWTALRVYGPEHANTFLNDSILDGDLLLVSTVLVGPLMHPLFKQYGEKDNPTAPFPLNWLFAAIIVSVALLSTVLFASIRVLKSDLIPELKGIHIDYVYVFVISYICGILSLLTTLFINSLRNLMEHWDVPRVFRSDTDVMLEEWKK